MWEKVQPALPPDVAAVTTSVWRYKNYGLVGLMRSSFLSPPVMWFQLLDYARPILRKAPGLLDELQCLTVSPTVIAEAASTDFSAQRFLNFMGFVETPTDLSRKLYTRSL